MALPVSPDPTDRRAAVVRMLTASPEGLSDAALARGLGGEVRTQTVNQLCRRMAAEGRLERVGTRPILNRLPAPPPARRRRKPRVARIEPERAAEPTTPPAAEPDVAPVEPEGAPREVAVVDASPEPVPASEQDAPAPDDAAVALCLPVYDALQAWSRVVNVQARVAGWLVRRGATLRWVSLDGGPARDLVASLDGDDVHVEVTGWPADGARTHPTTIAGDWFSAAEQAAVARRRAHPRARIVIALPDTRRYRSLTEQRSASLARVQAEVWFVDPAGAVHAS